MSICHYLNELHVYCRLRDIGISKRIAAFLAKVFTFDNKIGYLFKCHKRG